MLQAPFSGRPMAMLASPVLHATSFSSAYKWLALSGMIFVVFSVGAICALTLVALLLSERLWGMITGRPATTVPPLARRSLTQLLHFFSWLCRTLGLVCLRVDLGELARTPGPKIVVANHPSLLDALWLIPHLADVVCVAKADLARSPIWGLWIQVLGYACGQDPNQAIEHCLSHLQEGRSLLLFPEGTRSPKGSLTRFNRGAALLALRSGLPLTPVTIRYSPLIFGKAQSWFDYPNAAVTIELFAPPYAPPTSGGARSEGPGDTREQARQYTELLEDFFTSQLNNLGQSAR